MSLIRVVRMTFRPEEVPAFLENFEAHKILIRNFPGCRHLELWQDENQKNIFVTYSHWESEAALNQYRDSQLFKSVWSFTKTLFSEKPQAWSTKKLQEVGAWVCRKSFLYSYLHPHSERNGWCTCPDGGIGRRVGLKHQWGYTRAGSTPALGTKACSDASLFCFIGLATFSTATT